MYTKNEPNQLKNSTEISADTRTRFPPTETLFLPQI